MIKPFTNPGTNATASAAIDRQQETSEHSRLSPSPGNRCISVSRDEFLELLVAHRRLDRCDAPVVGCFALQDSITGDCFVIREEDLFGS